MEEDLREVFKQNLLRLIDIKKCTQRDIADYMHVSRPTVHSWVSGQKIPRMDKIDRLASFFECSRIDLMCKKTTIKDGGLKKAEDKLFDLFHQVPEADRGMVVEMVEAALKSRGLL